MYNRRVNSKNDSQLSCIKNQKMFWDPRDPSTFTYKLTFQCFQGREQVTSDEFSVDGIRFYLEIYSSGNSFYFYWNCSLFCPTFPEEDCYPTVCLHLADETIKAIQVRAKAMYILHLLINKPKMAYSRDLPKMAGQQWAVWHYGLKLQWYLSGDWDWRYGMVLYGFVVCW